MTLQKSLFVGWGVPPRIRIRTGRVRSSLHLLGFVPRASASSKRIHCLRSIQEPWHADVFEFLELRKNHGKEEQRARPRGVLEDRHPKTAAKTKATVFGVDSMCDLGIA